MQRLERQHATWRTATDALRAAAAARNLANLEVIRSEVDDLDLSAHDYRSIDVRPDSPGFRRVFDAVFHSPPLRGLVGTKK